MGNGTFDLMRFFDDYCLFTLFGSMCYNPAMIKKLFNSIKNSKKEPKQAPVQTKERKDLEQKVKEGTDFAIHEYRDEFKKLAEYDKR